VGTYALDAVDDPNVRHAAAVIWAWVKSAREFGMLPSLEAQARWAALCEGATVRRGEEGALVRLVTCSCGTRFPSPLDWRVPCPECGATDGRTQDPTPEQTESAELAGELTESLASALTLEAAPPPTDEDLARQRWAARNAARPESPAPPRPPTAPEDPEYARRRAEAQLRAIREDHAGFLEALRNGTGAAFLDGFMPERTEAVA
jgi:hypothetical protein